LGKADLFIKKLEEDGFAYNAILAVGPKRQVNKTGKASPASTGRHLV